MRHALPGLLLTSALIAACGGSDANEPEDPFPDAGGVYEISGGFDGTPTSVGSFEGTLELTQGSSGGAGARLQLHPDTPNAWDAWDLDGFYRHTASDLTGVAATIAGVSPRRRGRCRWP